MARKYKGPDVDDSISEVFWDFLGTEMGSSAAVVAVCYGLWTICKLGASGLAVIAAAAGL